MKKVALFIIGYKGYKYLERGVLDKILRAVKFDKKNKYYVVYLDNASRDGSIEYLKEHYSQIDILLSPENYLYDKSVNLGLQYIYNYYNPDYYLLVDIDNPCDENCYSELVKYANVHKKIGIVQPQVKSLKNKNLLYSCGHLITDNCMIYPRKEIPQDITELENQISVSISSTLIKREVFLRCGLLDEVFRMYYESADLSFRAREKGFAVGCAVNAIAYNEGTEKFTENNYHQAYYLQRNRLLFWRKHDRDVYEKVLIEYRNTANEYDSDYRGNTRIYDAAEHAKIKATKDVLRIVAKDVEEFTEVPQLESYSNLDLVVIKINDK